VPAVPGKIGAAFTCTACHTNLMSCCSANSASSLTIPCKERLCLPCTKSSAAAAACFSNKSYTVTHYLTDSVLVQSKRGSGVNVTEEQLFEHERFMPLAGWSSRHLLPTERNRYSRQEDGMNSTNTFPQIRLPDGKVASC